MFKLTDKFIQPYKRKKVNWGPLGYITYKRTYARGEEEWWQTCKRVVETTYQIQHDHCSQIRVPWNARKAQYSAQEMYDRMFNFKWLPPGRGLWAMDYGLIQIKGGAGLNNCAFVSTEELATDPTGPFTFLADQSMYGVGVAFDTNGVGTVTFKEPKVTSHIHVIDDSREGWVDAIGVVLGAYLGSGNLPMQFDYSKIRSAGEPIKTFGGIAPGPGPLKECIETLTSFCERAVEREDSSITSSDIVDLMNIIGRCVVAGGIRRTAELSLGDPDDQDYLELKDPGKYAKELKAWRWASNNSVSAYVGMNYDKLGAQTAINGEPGYFWLDTAKHFGRTKDGWGPYDLNVRGTNPCAEQSLESYEMCCLVETFPSLHETIEDYLITLKYAYLYAKTVTLIPTHDERTNAIMMRNRRIGLSQSGIVESFAKHGRRNHFRWCDEGYEYVCELDEEYSNWLCVPKSIKKTSIKPSGTVSLLPGVTPGIHYPHSEYYYRTIRIQKESPLIEAIREAGYRIEESVYGDNTWVVYFPVKEKYFDRDKESVSMWEQLENAAQMQYYWSDNQVSCTVTFKPEEAADIPKALELYEDRLKSVSFLPITDHSYEQAPYQEISEEEYNRAISNISPIKIRGMGVHDHEDKFCDGDRCEIK